MPLMFASGVPPKVKEVVMPAAAFEIVWLQQPDVLPLLLVLPFPEAGSIAAAWLACVWLPPAAGWTSTPPTLTWWSSTRRSTPSRRCTRCNAGRR